MTTYSLNASELRKQPCTCVPCAHCHGTGIIGWELFGRNFSKHRTDDLQEPVDCEECGSEEMCDRCRELEERWCRDLEELSQEQELQEEEAT